MRYWIHSKRCCFSPQFSQNTVTVNWTLWGQGGNTISGPYGIKYGPKSNHLLGTISNICDKSMREQERVKEEKRKTDRERENKNWVYSKDLKLTVLYTCIYICLYICIHLKIAEHCLLTISYFSTSVFAYFLWPFYPAILLGLRALESNLCWNI